MNLVANKAGEFAGCGPKWACCLYGQPGHDYLHCPGCWSRYELYLAGQLQQEVPE